MTFSESKSSFLGFQDLDQKKCQYFLNLGRALRWAQREGQFPSEHLKQHCVATAFFENSTRTKTAFVAAAESLGAKVMDFSSETSSRTKGESVGDTLQVLETYGATAVVIRHSLSGLPHQVALTGGLPVINAGDGPHEHPSQALLDALTLDQDWKGQFMGKRLLIIGDINQSRVARSNLFFLEKLGTEVCFSGPRTMIGPAIEARGHRLYDSLEEALPEVDAVMCLRIQHERQGHLTLPSTDEFALFWGMNPVRAEKMKPGAPILHPGPVNWGVELSHEMKSHERVRIRHQVWNGTFSRMAALMNAIEPQTTAKWLSHQKVPEDQWKAAPPQNLVNSSSGRSEEKS